MNPDIVDEIKKLEQPIRAYALVGAYVTAFNEIEELLNEISYAGIKLGLIASPDSFFSLREKKCNLKATFEAKKFTSEIEKLDQVDKIFQRFETERNVVMHLMASPSNITDGIRFDKVIEKKHEKSGPIDWSCDEIRGRLKEFRKVVEQLRPYASWCSGAAEAGTLNADNSEMMPIFNHVRQWQAYVAGMPFSDTDFLASSLNPSDDPDSQQ